MAGEQASIVVNGVLRIGVRSWGQAGNELMIELVRTAPNIVGLEICLSQGATSLVAFVRGEHVQDARSVLTCELAEQSAEEHLGASG